MPRSLNRCTLLGHIGKDAEVKTTGGGASVANFSLATSRRWKDKQSGEWREETDWHRIVMWQADKVGAFLLKGKAVLVEGRLQTRSYEDKGGEKRYVTEVVADNLILLGGGREEGGGEHQIRSQPRGAAAPAPSYGPSNPDPALIDDSDVPF